MVDPASIELCTMAPTMSDNSHAGATTFANGDPWRTPATATSSGAPMPDPNDPKPPFRISLIQKPELSLPAVYHKPKTHKYAPLTDLPAFVAEDLDVARLDDIFAQLWLCGKKNIARPLHRQKGVLGRSVVVTEQADFHMTWDDDEKKILIKPLPAYLLNRKFWIRYICPDPIRFRNAVGFLRSYVHLITREIDFDLALEERLLPKIHAVDEKCLKCEGYECDIASRVNIDEDEKIDHIKVNVSKGEDLTWTQWHAFAKDFTATFLDGTPEVLKKTRWEHSELRQGRLNLAYRLGKRKIFRGYAFTYATYNDFLADNSSWLIAAFAYVAIVHGAMQVALGTPQLAENEDFARACYGFAVFSIVAPVGILLLLTSWMVCMGVDNLLFARKDDEPRYKKTGSMSPV